MPSATPSVGTVRLPSAEQASIIPAAVGKDASMPSSTLRRGLD